MRKEKVLTIDSTASLTRNGRPAIRRAIRDGKIQRTYMLDVGGQRIALLPLDLVITYWFGSKPMNTLQQTILDDLQQLNIRVTAANYELEILWGDIQCYIPTESGLQKEVLPRTTKKDEEGHDE